MVSRKGRGEFPETEGDEVQQRFRDWYGREADVLTEIELEVIGADYGASGYTTRRQVDELARWLELGPGDCLLDIGAGRGWPGLYLASETDCSVVVTDLPYEGLLIARRRAHADGLDPRAQFAMASATDLPFPSESFDAIVHTDVLC